MAIESPQPVTQEFLNNLKSYAKQEAVKAAKENKDYFVIIPQIHYFDLEYDTKGMDSWMYAWVNDYSFTWLVVEKLKSFGYTKVGAQRIGDNFSLVADVPEILK